MLVSKSPIYTFFFWFQRIWEGRKILIVDGRSGHVRPDQTGHATWHENTQKDESTQTKMLTHRSQRTRVRSETRPADSENSSARKSAYAYRVWRHKIPHSLCRENRLPTDRRHREFMGSTVGAFWPAGGAALSPSKGPPLLLVSRAARH